MNNPPRIHHFVPQFWIKRFAGADGKVWAFDKKDGRIRERSSRKLMQVFNLYTMQPSGLDDTTLETVDLNEIDSAGAATFDRVLAGNHGEAAKEDFAAFLAAQIMRDPATVTSYNLKAQEMALSLLEAFEAPDYPEFCKCWRALFPGTYCAEESEYNSIKLLGLRGVEDAVEQIIMGLDASDGLPELPFTDVIRASEGREFVRKRLLELGWFLKLDPNNRFVLGDTGVLFEKGMLVSLRVPLSSSAALYLTGPTAPDIVVSPADAYEVDSLNFESAARARRWLVGERSVLEQLRSQVGSNPLPSK